MKLADAKKIVAEMKASRDGSAISMTDTVAEGYLSIYKEFGDGSRECILENDPNVITYASRRHHLEFLYNTNVTQDILSSFKVGTGGAVGDDQGGNTNGKVINPDPTRNDLFSPITLANTSITLTPSDPVDLPNEVYLQIIFSLNQDDANGLGINECGVFKQSGSMFNHKTFLSIQKSESFSLIFDWKIRYV